MNIDRLSRLHRLRRAVTDQRAVAVARELGRVHDALAAEADSVAARERLRAGLAEGSRPGRAISVGELGDRHEGAEYGVRTVVRFGRRVAEAQSLLEAARAEARAARTEEERLDVLLVAEWERHTAEALRIEGLEHDEMATIRHRRLEREDGPDGEGGEGE